MAEVINLGQFGEQRKSPWGELGHNFLEGYKAGEEARHNKADEALNKRKLVLERELAVAKSKADSAIAAVNQKAASLRTHETNMTNLLSNRERIGSAEGMNAERIAASTANNQAKIASDEALTGVRTSSEMAQNDARIQAAASRQREQIMADAANEKSKMAASLARQKFDEESTNRKNAMDTMEKQSVNWAHMDAEKQALFKSSDHYKELYGFYNKYLPEFVNKDKKEIQWMDSKDVYTNKLEGIKAQNAQILASGGKLSPGQQSAQDLMDKVEPQMLAAALDATGKDPNLVGASQEEFAAALQKNLHSITGVRDSQRSGGAMPNAKDPLGLFSGGQ